MAENLAAVDGDPNNHPPGGKKGRLRVQGDKTVLVENKAIVTHSTPADPDEFHPPPPTDTKEGSYSNTVFAYNKHVHRVNDLRQCDAKTEQEGNSTVYVGD